MCGVPRGVGYVGKVSAAKRRGRSIGELDIRRKYGVNILGVKREEKTDVNISPETALVADVTLLVLGENQKLKKHFHL